MVPSTLKSAIIDRLKFTKEMQPEPNQPNVIIIGGKSESESEHECEPGINALKRKIKDILIQSNIREFVAITDPLDPKKILIAGNKDAERLDSFHCPHCGMEFIDEIQVGIHQRLHLPF
jgi:hypothetical protein